MYIFHKWLPQVYTRQFTRTWTAWHLGGAGRFGGCHREGKGWNPTGSNLRRDCCKWERNKRLLYPHTYVLPSRQFHSIIEPHTPALKVCLVRMCDRWLWHLTLYCVMEQQGIMLIDSYLCVIGPIYEVWTCAAVEVTLYGVCCEENWRWTTWLTKICMMIAYKGVRCHRNEWNAHVQLLTQNMTWAPTARYWYRTWFHHGIAWYARNAGLSTKRWALNGISSRCWQNWEPYSMCKGIYVSYLNKYIHK